MPSVVVAPTAIVPGSRPSAFDIASDIGPRCAASRGSSAIAMTWALVIVQPSSRSFSATIFRNSQPEVSFQRGSPDGKVPAHVAEPGRAEDRVDERVHHRVAVGVTEQAAAVGDQDASEHQRPPGDEAVRVDAMTDPRGHRTSSSSERSRTRSCGNVILKLRGSPGTTVTGDADRLDQRGVVAGADPVGRCVLVCAAQQIGAEGLGRLRRDDRGAVEGGRDPAVLHLLHSVHAGYPGDRRSIRAGGVEHRPEDVGWRERTGSVVDGDPVVAVAAVDRGGDAVLAALAALEEHDIGELMRRRRWRGSPPSAPPGRR